MITINSVKISAKKNIDLKEFLKNKYSFKSQINDFGILKKSLDARDKNDIKFVYSFSLNLDSKEEKFLVRKYKNIDFLNKKEYSVKTLTNKKSNEKCIIVGMGPAGLLAAYVLSEAGLNPVIIEKGKPVEERLKDVNEFFENGKLDIFSNVQFGEGGAGTFSDGKLNTGIKDPEGRKDFLLKTFVSFGAPENIIYDSKPHIGTDVLTEVIKNLRRELIKRGVNILYSKEFISFKDNKGKIESVEIKDVYTEKIETLECSKLILATGHSARNTFEYLSDKLKMETKPFAMGFRVIHKQSFIDESQYGVNFEDLYENLEPSPYKLTHQSIDRGVYTFCMCPGGFVVNASSESNRTCINGMSNNKRNSGYANSAVIVQIKKEDLDENDILSGMKFQRNIEEKTYSIGKGAVPICDFRSFLKDFGNKCELEFENCAIKPEEAIKGETVNSDISKIYPDFVNNAFSEAMLEYDIIIKDYAKVNPLICASETRSSSPVKILRNEEFESNILGIYPCGEGAGYAGGIVSAAIDGMKVAEKIIDKINLQQ